MVGLGYRSHNLAGGGRSGDFMWIRDYSIGKEGWVAGAYITWQCAGQTHPAG